MRSEIKESRIEHFSLLLFNQSNQALLRRAPGAGEQWSVSATGQAEEGESIQAAVARVTEKGASPVSVFEIDGPGEIVRAVFFARIPEEAESGGRDRDDDERFFSLEEIRKGIASEPTGFSAEIRAIIERIDPYVIRIPYLDKKEHDYIYQFRPERQRNREVYNIDRQSEALYQSALCQAIKEVKRKNERSSSTPAVLDFGAVSYVLPSHFGFCLGVQNAIERAYETIAENPGRTVFMLSELIHNPFVNEDLLARGLRYLQTDKGEAIRDERSGALLWDCLTKDDVVIIPAFGATDEDKARLIEKGIAINRYDATCMLVEKVWKAAQRFGRDGYTVIIHGKAEHEETKATFSNTAKSGAAVTIRNREEAERLAAVILAESADEKRKLFEFFEGRHTPNLDPARDLERLAVVNQTTLLRNETLAIIRYFESILADKYGRENVGRHLNSNSKGDTLCYATQVNQDALQKALAMEIDLALVAGGRNSSNTYQLFRLCQERLGERSFYIQSERNILSADRILHHSFQSADDGTAERTFLTGLEPPVRILLTGGASCPDGIIQQVITRVNSLFPAEQIRSVSEVLDDLE